MRVINIVNFRKVPINRFDNGVSLKLVIVNLMHKDPTRLTLYHNGIPINENDFIHDSVEQLEWQENTYPINDIILKIRKNYYNLPKFIQISSDDTIGKVGNVLLEISPSPESFTIFDENDNELQTNQTVAQCNLVDKSKITVCRGCDQMVQLMICGALSDVRESFEEKFRLQNSVVELKQFISAKKAMGKELQLALFTKTAYLSERKKLFNYLLQNGDTVFYVDLVRKEPLEVGRKLKKGKYATRMEGKSVFPHEPIILNRYNIDKTNLINNKILQYEIISRLNLTSPRFVLTISMFQEGKYFYIAMEKMQCSLRSRLKEGPLNESRIIHYCKQILEGLGTMHDKKLLHRNMNCSSVLLDLEDNVKLCNFHLTKYLPNETTQQLLDGIPQSKIEDSKMWVAPEVLSGEWYGIKADVWSFGATLIEMITGKPPYHDLTTVRATYEIINNKTITYDRNLSVRLNEVVDLCIKADPEQRATISQLIDKFKNM